MLYIDKIFIENKYRNRGIGTKIVKELPRLVKQILKLKPGCIVLLANPFEMKGNDLNASKDKKEIENLINFYTKNGFERIEDTQYLVRNMDYKY